MSDKKVSITEFVNKYKQLSSVDAKKKMVKSTIRRTYVPVIEKKMILDLMAQKSVKDDGVKYIDMFVNRLNFIVAIISLYTTILPEKDEEGKSKSFEMYDLLVENGILDFILDEIGEREISELTSINGVVLDNWHAANTSTEVYVNNLIEKASQKFGLVASVGMEKLSTVLDDEVKFKRILGSLDKVLKRIK